MGGSKDGNERTERTERQEKGAEKTRPSIAKVAEEKSPPLMENQIDPIVAEVRGIDKPEEKDEKVKLYKKDKKEKKERKRERRERRERKEKDRREEKERRERTGEKDPEEPEAGDSRSNKDARNRQTSAPEPGSLEAKALDAWLCDLQDFAHFSFSVFCKALQI